MPTKRGASPLTILVLTSNEHGLLAITTPPRHSPLATALRPSITGIVNGLPETHRTCTSVEFVVESIRIYKFYDRLYRCDSDVLQYCLSTSKYCKNVINLFNEYEACVGDVVDTDVIFCKFTDLYRLKCVC